MIIITREIFDKIINTCKNSRENSFFENVVIKPVVSGFKIKSPPIVIIE